jgi:hypothetical protein
VQNSKSPHLMISWIASCIAFPVESDISGKTLRIDLKDRLIFDIQFLREEPGLYRLWLLVKGLPDKMAGIYSLLQITNTYGFFTIVKGK